MAIVSFREAAPRRVWAGFCLILFLALQVLSSSTALHKLVHADADSFDHHCAVTMFSRGQVNAAEVTVTLAALSVAFAFFLPALIAAEFPSFAYSVSSSRAPPRR